MSDQPEKPHFDYSHLRGAESSEPRPAPTLPSVPTHPLPSRPAHPVQKPQNWACVIVAVVLLIATIIGSVILVVGIRYYRQAEENLATTATFEAVFTAPTIEPTSVVYEGEGGLLNDEQGNSMSVQYQPWNGEERYTILLLGLDKRPQQTGRYFRTDVVMIISLDPKTNSIGILSIPRATYVDVPGGGMQLINAGWVIGELEQEGRGPERMVQTVQYNFGIRVHSYIVFDFISVIDLIDAIGGIDIYLDKAVTDHAYPTFDYGTEEFHLDAGQHHLDGETALKYARTRHQTDDVDRASRQQEVIMAVRDKILSTDMIDDLILQAPGLYNELSGGVETNMSLDQMIELGLWAADVPQENIHQGVLSWDYQFGWQTPGGASVLVPKRNLLNGLMVEVFGEDYEE